ncbi:hypothetical protein GCM10027277_48990 [Pseudoduganella ginsengisoli]|uniref:Uncharacterized protein n=1 Tax=Pseudoduganella ginsengisoli TaxID=1462440 RepID=A0A6L6Q4B0_9BURK|nr:hypothetical protein [Pseudoduganella ginsengisoli]MTW04520.1 hypothetical protein [Pseudoduganella ginsengisoli]
MLAAATVATVATVAVAAEPETRSPNEGEMQSFAAYYQAPPGAVARPAFDIRRGGAVHGWSVAAWTEDKPQRAAWSLCLAQRHGHAYDGKAWHATGVSRRYVWLDRASDCGVSPQRVLLGHDMADRDIVTLLEGQAAVLQGARLLFAGNTQCAPMRALPFKLVGLGLDKDGMVVMTYRSDRESDAQVTVRKRGRELTAWNVKC